MKLTILTPTYNRKHTLSKLYASLITQTLKSFEWIIVDDGSVDGTEEFVNNLIAESEIDIKYFAKPNGGKHTALNVGIQNAKGDMTIIVDSDDYLEKNAVETISCYYDKYCDNKTICGFSFLRLNENRLVIGENFLEYEHISNYIDCRINNGINGDKAEVYFTDVLKKYPFPEFEGEKFISEDVVWIEIAKKFDTVHINKGIYICEYLQGGLTDSDKKMKFSSPKGNMLRGKQMMYNRCNLKSRIKGAIIYNCYKLETRNFNIPIENIFEMSLIIITKPLGLFFNKKWKDSIQ